MRRYPVESIAQTLNELFDNSADHRIVADSLPNRLIVKAPPQSHNVIRLLLDQFEPRPGDQKAPPIMLDRGPIRPLEN
jgi:hypothetical protein